MQGKGGGGGWPIVKMIHRSLSDSARDRNGFEWRWNSGINSPRIFDDEADVLLP